MLNLIVIFHGQMTSIER